VGGVIQVGSVLCNDDCTAGLEVRPRFYNRKVCNHLPTIGFD